MLNRKRSLAWTVALASVFALAVAATQVGQAQTFKVLYNFTGGQDGAAPYDGLTIDRTGNLYGTAAYGGQQGPGCPSSGANTGCGTVFKLAPVGSGWVLKPVYNFKGGDDVGNPGVGVVFGPDGALYGAAGIKGSCDIRACGTVFSLRPPPAACRNALCSWNETILHHFTGQPDGSFPASRVVFDTAGNLYGSTLYGGGNGGYAGYGTIYELTPENGGWIESILYSFFYDLGWGPSGPLVLDAAGNLYGTSNYCGGNCYGTAWQLAPSQSGWTYSTLHSFNGYDGAEPDGLISDSSGNLYGFTYGAVGNQSATIYQLTPSNGGWTYSLVYDFGFEAFFSGLSVDAAGNLYGVNSGYPFGVGTIFKLTNSGGTWTYSDLHDFSGNDGESPYGAVVFDANGNLYGTTTAGGRHGYGVIFEITP